MPRLQDERDGLGRISGRGFVGGESPLFPNCLGLARPGLARLRSLCRGRAGRGERRWASLRAALLFGLSFVASVSCLNEANNGVTPPLDRIRYLSGAVLDPRPTGQSGEGSACSRDSECPAALACVEQKCRGAARYLIAVNANSDRQHNGSTLIPIDLQAFLDAAGNSAKLGGFDQVLDAATPCRRSRFRRELIECDERFFTLPEAAAIIGSYAGAPAAQLGSAGEAVLVVPVTGDPSLTLLRLSGGLSGGSAANQAASPAGTNTGPLQLRCWKGEGPRCRDDSRLEFVEGKAEARRLALHPRGILTLRQDQKPAALGLHGTSPEISVVDLDVGGSSGQKAAIVETLPAMIGGPVGGGNPDEALPGGAAMALYPCRPGQDAAKTPGLSQNCRNPLVYASYRSQARVAVLNLVSADKGGAECPANPPAGSDCGLSLNFVDVFQSSGPVVNGGGSQSGFYSGDALGAMAFAPSGEELYILQRDPGALLKVDTSMDASRKMPRNQFVGAVDICSAATDLELFQAQSKSYALISCRDRNSLYLVDVEAMQVIRIITVGATPSQIIIDRVRKLAYVTSFTASMLSVVDLDPQRRTRFSEIARLGGQTP